jgi:hypothetical protein
MGFVQSNKPITTGGDFSWYFEPEAKGSSSLLLTNTRL